MVSAAVRAPAGWRATAHHVTDRHVACARGAVVTASVDGERRRDGELRPSMSMKSDRLYAPSVRRAIAGTVPRSPAGGYRVLWFESYQYVEGLT